MLNTRKVLQSLAYNPLGGIVLLLANTIWNTPNYWSLQCLAARPLVSVAEVTPEKFSTQNVQLS